MRKRREFNRVADLHDRGLIDQTEFQRLRGELLGPDAVASDQAPSGPYLLPRPVRGFVRRILRVGRRPQL